MQAARLAVFDLDGTITRRDTLLPYIAGFHAGRPWQLARGLAAGPQALRFITGQRDHGALKGALIEATLGGLSRQVLAEWTARFVPRLLTHGTFADARSAIERHRARGHRMVLLSASTELYVPAIGAALGFDEVICTGLEWSGERLIGTLRTANRRGAEKTRCVLQLRAAWPGLPMEAYGNASSDLEHLALAEHGVLVNGSTRSRQAARRLGVDCVTWR